MNENLNIGSNPVGWCCCRLTVGHDIPGFIRRVETLQWCYIPWVLFGIYLDHPRY